MNFNYRMIIASILSVPLFAAAASDYYAVTVTIINHGSTATKEWRDSMALIRAVIDYQNGSDESAESYSEGIRRTGAALKTIYGMIKDEPTVSLSITTSSNPVVAQNYENSSTEVIEIVHTFTIDQEHITKENHDTIDGLMHDYAMLCDEKQLAVLIDDFGDTMERVFTLFKGTAHNIAGAWSK